MKEGSLISQEALRSKEKKTSNLDQAQEMLKRNNPDLWRMHEIVESKVEGIRIQPDDLVDLYGQEVIEQDKRRVVKKKLDLKDKLNAKDPETIARELKNKYLADIEEYLLVDLCYKHDFMGDNLGMDGKALPEDAVVDFADIVVASEYDDLFNGVDSIFRPGGIFTDYEGVGTFTFDVTHGGSQTNLEKKDRAAHDHERVDLGRLKYFDLGENFSHRGEHLGLPRYIVGVNSNTIEELGKSMLLNPNDPYKGEHSPTAKNNIDSLGHNVLMQLCLQSLVNYVISDQTLKREWGNKAVPDVIKQHQFVRTNQLHAFDYFSTAIEKKVAQAGKKLTPFIMDGPPDATAARVMAYFSRKLAEGGVMIPTAREGVKAEPLDPKVRQFWEIFQRHRKDVANITFPWEEQ